MHALALAWFMQRLRQAGSSSQGIPDGGRTLIELWVLDAGNRSTAGASGQPCPQHNPCGRGRRGERQTVGTVGVPLCSLWIKALLDNPARLTGG